MYNDIMFRRECQGESVKIYRIRNPSLPAFRRYPADSFAEKYSKKSAGKNFLKKVFPRKINFVT